MLFSVKIHGTFDIPKCAIFREYSRNIGVQFGYFPWRFTERSTYLNALFSVNIHGTLEYNLAIFREDSQRI